MIQFFFQGISKPLTSRIRHNNCFCVQALAVPRREIQYFCRISNLYGKCCIWFFVVNHYIINLPKVVIVSQCSHTLTFSRKKFVRFLTKVIVLDFPRFSGSFSLSHFSENALACHCMVSLIP